MQLNISICDLIVRVMVMGIDVLCVSVTEVVLRVYDKGLVVSEQGDRDEVMPEVSAETNQPDSLYRGE